MVTAEFAVALPALVVVVVAALFGVIAMTDQLRCADAAATAARLAGRGDSIAEARAVALHAAPRGAVLSIQQTASTTIAIVTFRLRPPGALRRLPAITFTERSVAPREPG
jgi:Flp pilus assembly protein TadG